MKQNVFGVSVRRVLHTILILAYEFQTGYAWLEV